MLRTTRSNFSKSNKASDRISQGTKSVKGLGTSSRRLKSNMTYKSITKESQQSMITDENATVISQRECKHTKVKYSSGGECANCGYQIAQFGSIFDTGTIKSYIKVLYVDESRKPTFEKLNSNSQATTVKEVDLTGDDRPETNMSQVVNSVSQLSNDQ